MSFLGRFLASRADPVTLEEFGAILAANRGGRAYDSRAGVKVNVRRALGITAWYSGVRYLAESVAGLPVHTFRDLAGRRSRRADPPWLRRPDRELPRFGLFEFVMMHILHRGNAYLFKLRDDLGRVTGLRPLHSDRVTPGLASDGTKVFAVKIDDAQGQVVPFTTNEILHIPGLSYDGVIGLDPIRHHAESLGGVAAADEYAGRFFGQGQHAQAYISVPQKLSKEQADEYKQEWLGFHRGVANAHEIGVLSLGAEYRTIGLDPQQTQLLESRNFGVSEVARILRIPPHKLYDLTRATFSNIEHQAIEAVVDSIRPWAVRIEAWANFDPHLLPPANFIEFQVEGLLRGDTKSRYEAYRLSLGGHPWQKVNEVRRLENRDEVEGGDVIPQPLNMGTGGE